MVTAANPDYGVTIGLNPAAGQAAQPFANWSLLLADMAALGLGTLRFQLSWNNIQLHQADPPSTWSWAALDDAVYHANSNNLFLIYTLRGAPSWALSTASMKATTEPWYLMDPAMAQGFAQAVAQRYNGVYSVPGYGPLFLNALGWNEDFNIHHTNPSGGFFGIHNSPYSEYNGIGGVTSGIEPARDPYFHTQVLPGVASVVRQYSPRTMVGLAAIWWRNYPNCADFLRGIYAAGIASSFDWVDFHYYSNAAEPSTAGSGGSYSPSFAQEWQAMQTVMATNGDGSKPIWITEIGWGTNANNGSSIDCSESVQATRFDYVIKSAQASNCVRKFIFYTLNYKTQNGGGQAITDTSSIVQWDVPSQSYRKLAAYAVIQADIAQQPSLSAAPITAPEASSRDGIQEATSRDGLAQETGSRDGVSVEASSRDGIQEATSRDGIGSPTLARG